MDNPLEILRIMLLAVVFLPLLMAGIVASMGCCCPGFARRLALWFALLHLGLTGTLAWLVADQLLEKASWSSPTDLSRTTFEPIGVPGDPGQGLQSSGQIHETRWALLRLNSTVVGLPPSEIQFFLGLDGLNIWLIALTSFMTLVAILVSWDSIHTDSASFFAWLFFLETGILGAFAAFDLILFYVFFELTLIPSFFLIGHWGTGASRRDAARKFFLYTLFGSLLTLIGVIGVVAMNPTPMVERGSSMAVQYAITNPDKAIARLESGPLTFSIPRLIRNVQTWSSYYPARVETASRESAVALSALKQMQQRLDAERIQQRDALAQVAAEKAAGLVQATSQYDNYRQAQICLFLLLMAGFAVKTPIVPFHTWLPSAYFEAPIGVTVILAAVMSKLGTYGILRIVLPLTPDAAFEYGLPVFGLLGGFGIVYAAFCAFAQRDAKLLVAYSSVTHLGLVILALFTLNREGLSGDSLHMLNHGLSTGAMFALLAFLIDRYGTLDRQAYSGLIALFPGFAFVMFAIALATVGLPGLNNFVSEMLMIAGLFDPVHTQSLGYGLAFAAASGIFLSAWYTMTLLKQLFFGPAQVPPTKAGVTNDLTPREWAAFGLPLALCLFLGLFPQAVLDTIRPDVNVIVQSADAARSRAGYAPSPTERVPLPLIPEADPNEAPATP